MEAASIEEKYQVLLDMCASVSKEVQYTKIIIDKLYLCEKVELKFKNGEWCLKVVFKEDSKVGRFVNSSIESVLYDFVNQMVSK